MQTTITYPRKWVFPSFSVFVIWVNGERYLAYRFEVSRATVSRIITTWINFLYVKFEQIPIWPPRNLVNSNMPKQFRKLYPTTCVIVDATEIFIEQPCLPELQQVTFSNYKNHNTFKALIGISPRWSNHICIQAFPWLNINQRTCQKKWSDWYAREWRLSYGQSWLWHWRWSHFKGVHLNIPAFLWGKQHIEEKELIITRRITSLCIHVEWAMERIKNYHIFNRTAGFIKWHSW